MSRIPYNRDPDFSRPLLQIAGEARERMVSRLEFLYGEELAGEWMPELERILKVHCAHKPQEMIDREKEIVPAERFTEEDMILITYGDSIKGGHGATIKALHRFVKTYSRGAVNTIHLLPFFPYSSDRGFAVVDFDAVDPKMGTWECIRELGVDYELMFDGVLNHCSSRSEMFRGFLRGDPQYRDFFIAYDSPDDLTADQRSKIFRPRTSDILTRFDTIDGEKYLWTTFSEDQIDFNFRNPRVLLTVLSALLFYIRRGADILRLDAVTYLWSEPGTECIHLPQTHAIIKLLRDVIDTVAPGVALITETNVPHEQNISYFGDGADEAHMVYNFALPPLVLHTFYSQDATAIARWAAGLRTHSKSSTFFNMLDTHDGIGVMGVRGILAPEEIEAMVERARSHGAYISYKSSEKGEEPYEINSTWWSAINDDAGNEDLALQVKRYVASRTVALVLKGVPGVYTHGALALKSDHRLVEQTGIQRDVNRGTIDPDLYAEELETPGSKRALLQQAYQGIGLIRTQNRVFHPQGGQQVFELDPRVLSILRVSPEGDQRILCLIGVSDKATRVEITVSELGVQEQCWRDLVSGQPLEAVAGSLAIDLPPYAVMWLIPETRADEVLP